MAPIGVLTAVVSAIRVGGDASLRAFIGRAQEGSGNAEAELCSSTSRDVCELSNNGGIARVFGRPKILEVVHDKERTFNLRPDPEVPDVSDKAGTYTFKEYFNLPEQKEWLEGNLKPSDEENHSKRNPDSNHFAPHPNLSLNVGIKKLPRYCFYIAAILGLVLQAGVLVFAALATYSYPDIFKRDETQIAVPAFPFCCAGTILLCFGVGMCAFIVESSTGERSFRRTANSKSRLYWIQPGGQVVGDQVFEYFACSDSNRAPIKEYTTSWKRSAEHTFKQLCMVWAAILATTAGFVLQFLGLRTLHSTVSVAQFGVMLIMTIVRTLLRTQRLKREDNEIGDSYALYQHHELDWLALQMVDVASNALNHSKSGELRWGVSCGVAMSPLGVKQGIHVKYLSGPTYTNSDDELLQSSQSVEVYWKRARLARLTGAQSSLLLPFVNPAWDASLVASRGLSLKLAKLIEDTISTLRNGCEMNMRWEEAISIVWEVPFVEIGTMYIERDTRFIFDEGKALLSIRRNVNRKKIEGPWRADRSELEAVLGLWLLAIKIGEQPQQTEEEQGIEQFPYTHLRSTRIVSALGADGSPDAESNLNIWMGHRSLAIRHTDLEIKGSSDLTPGDFLVEKGGTYKFLNYNKPRKLVSRPKDCRRFFGWHLVPGHLLYSLTGRCSVLQVSSESPLDLMCAQELFALFLTTLMPLLGDIGGSTEIVKGVQRLYVANQTITELVRNFTASGIGSEDDALTCIVPILYAHQKLTYSTAFSAARDDGDGYRRKNEWGKAEEALTRALDLLMQEAERKGADMFQDIQHTSEREICTLSLCELYRWALFGNKQSLLFGLRGMLSIYERHLDVEKIPMDVHSYLDVAVAVARNQDSDQDIRKASDDLQKHQPQPHRMFSNLNPGDFHDVLEQGDMSATLYLLRGKAFSTCTSIPALALAARYGWYMVVKSFRELGADTRDVDPEGLNFLHYAVQHLTTNTFVQVVRGKEDLLRRTDDSGKTTLHLASAVGKTGSVRILVEKYSLDPRQEDEALKSAIDHSIFGDQPHTIMYFISWLQGQQDAPDEFKICCKLLFHATCGSSKVAREILAREVILVTESRADTGEIEKKRIFRSVEEELRAGSQVMNEEALANHINLAAALLVFPNCGYDVNTSGENGRIALSYAAEANQPGMVNFLLDKGAETASKDRKGRTSLHHAVLAKSESALIALIDSGANVEIKDHDGMTPFAYATRSRDPTFTSLLLKGGACGSRIPLQGTSITAITTASDCRIYFQDTDAQIRTAVIGLQDSETIAKPGLALFRAKLFTPLAAVSWRGGEEVGVLPRKLKHLAYTMTTGSRLLHLGRRLSG